MTYAIPNPTRRGATTPVALIPNPTVAEFKQQRAGLLKKAELAGAVAGRNALPGDLQLISERLPQEAYIASAREFENYSLYGHRQLSPRQMVHLQDDWIKAWRKGWRQSVGELRKKLNPAEPPVTDRALRYRAQRNPPPGPRVCHYCGSDRNVEIEHVDGREENTKPENLSWACRSCNTRKGAYFARQDVGRKTRQFNPSKARGARTLRQWLNAVLSIQGVGGDLTPTQAIATIQATPHAKRTAFIRQIAAGNIAARNPQPELGPHGPIFRQFYHDAKGAIRKLKQMQTGEAVAALYHPKVGDIDLIWGRPGTAKKKFKDGYGLSHILTRKDRDAIVADLQELLLGMRRQAEPQRRETDEIRLSDGRHVAIISLVWQPSRHPTRLPTRWYLSAFYDDDRKQNGSKAIRRKDLDVSGAHASGTTLPSGGSTSSMGKQAATNNPEPSYEQYLWAVSTHARGAHDDGGRVIHATSKATRSKYARKIWDARRFHGTDHLTGRRRDADEVPF